MSRLLLLNLDPMWKLSMLNSTSYKISSMTYFSPSLRTDWIISEEWKGTAQDFNREESIQKGADSKQHRVISRGNLWSPYCLASCKHVTHRLETLKQLTRRSTLKHSQEYLSICYLPLFEIKDLKWSALQAHTLSSWGRGVPGNGTWTESEVSVEIHSWHATLAMAQLFQSLRIHRSQDLSLAIILVTQLLVKPPSTVMFIKPFIKITQLPTVLNCILIFTWFP